MKILTACLLFLLSVNLSLAQELTISGTVTDAQGKPIPGVEVKVYETNAITYTSGDGSFKISLGDGYETLVFSLDGYKTQKIFAGGLTEINLSLIESAGDGDSFSVGFGKQSKNENTGSIAQIGGDDISGSPMINLEQANQGKSAGMFVQNSSGKLGENTTVRIRGGSSLSNSNQPLYVVDGVPLVSSNQSNINPNNIASIEILKDASAAAIYGSRAANGVIIITTKSGISGKIKIEADYQFGVSQTPKYLDLLSPEEFDLLALEHAIKFLSPQGTNINRDGLEEFSKIFSPTNNSFNINGGTITVPTNFAIFQFKETKDTDWQKEVFRTGLSHTASANVQGGRDKFGFLVSASLNTQEGILIGNKFDRFNSLVSISGKISEKLSINSNLNYIYTKDWRLREDADLGSPLQAIALPSSDGYDPNNEYRVIVSRTRYNPLREINFSDNLGYNNSLVGSLGLNYEINDTFTFDITGGVDLSNLRTEWRLGPETLNGGNNGRTELSTSNLRNIALNSWFTYQKQLNIDNKISVILGTSYQESNSDFTFKSADVNGLNSLKSLETGDPRLRIEDIPSGSNVLISSFGRINYSFRNKYLVQLSGRIDGSSKFGKSNRYGAFPAASAGWVLSEESFLSQQNVLSFLKLKSSFGVIGNVPFDDFLSKSIYFSTSYNEEEATRLSNLQNSKIKWETTMQYDLGIEFILFKRLSGSFEYYNKKTTDLLFPVPVTSTSGLSSITKNLGTMGNNGLEINLSTENITRNNFIWTTDFNISSNQNKITNLGGNNLIEGASAYLEGNPAGSFYLQEYAGVYENAEPALDGIIPLGTPLYYLNREATPDEISDQYAYKLDGFGDRYLTDEWDRAQRVVVGNPNPKYFGGLTNNLSYKNFDLSFLIQFVEDVDIYYETGEYIANSGYQLLGQLSSQVDRYYSSSTKDLTKFPRYDQSEENTNPSSRWIEDGSYIRLKSVNLTFHFPQSILNRWKISYLDIYLGGTNLLTFTDYIGYDPDVNSIDPLQGIIGQNIVRGVDNFTAPQPRMFITGIKIGL